MRLACALVALAAGTAGAAPVRTATSDPHPGIHVERWSDAAVPAKLVLVAIDLSAAELALVATGEADKGITTRQFASRVGAQVAINGGAFAVAGFTPRGLAIGSSVKWTNTADTAALAVFHLRRVGERTLAAISPPEELVAEGDLPVGTQGAISGQPLLVRAGAVSSQFDCADPVTLACERAPRSALALSADGNTLWLVTVDGWQAGSIGLTAAELAGFLRARGAYMAMALDGGAASTLVLDGVLANAPSDGVERAVANHLGIQFGDLPNVTVTGTACQDSISACVPTSGVLVTLDDGRTRTTGVDGQFTFPDVTIRTVCLTGRRTGFKTATQCKALDPTRTLEYMSFVLVPGMDAPPDAGVPDAPTPEDARLDGPDAGRPDAGSVDPPTGTGCCDAGRDHPPIALLALVGWMLMRRSGYNRREGRRELDT